MTHPATPAVDAYSHPTDPSVIPLAPRGADESMGPPVRTLHLINGQHYSGAERVQDLLALRLPELGFEVDFACLKHGQFARMRHSHRSRIFPMAMRFRWDLRVVNRLETLVRQGGYQILHAHTPRTVMIGSLLAKATRLPLVFHVHSPTSRDSTRRWHNRVNHWIEKRSLHGAQRIVAVSHSLKQHMERVGHPAEKLSVVPNGVPMSVLNDRQPPGGRWVFGTVALFRPRKGVEVLLQALAQCTDRYDIHLRAVGPFETPEYERHLRNVVAQLKLSGRVTWTGFTRDVHAELSQMDGFILPSLFGEGLPMVVLEAMAAGVPVIATRVEGIPEALRDGIDGLLVPPGCPHVLAAAVGRLISDPSLWPALRQSAHGRQQRYFSDQSMARGVAHIYQHVLKATRT